MNKEQAAQLLRRAGCAGASFVWDEGTIRDDVTDALKIYSTWPADEGEGRLLAAAPELARWGIEQAEEAERLRAETERLQAELEALREAWTEVRGVAVACIEGDPYGNEAASVVISTMDAMMPEWAGKALAPPPAAPAPKPPYVAPPSPTPAPPQWRWEKQEAYRDGAWRVRGMLTHLPSGIADTSGWWLDSGDAHAEAAQGIRNKLAEFTIPRSV